VDGQETGASFNHPEDIAVDQAGFFYVVDRDNKRVLRYSSAPPTFTKRVDEEQYTKGVPLDDPIAIAADTLRAYIGDRGAGKIYYYLRRP
jgi:NHL repeat-containing protein